VTEQTDAPVPRAPIPDTTEPRALRVVAADGAVADLLLCAAAELDEAHPLVYWLPAMGVPARHYLPLAQALAVRGVTVAIHEWRGIGSSDRRASRRQNWGYRELLTDDLPAGLAAVRERLPQASCWLGGHSLGGQIATLYASQDDSLAGLLLVASGAPYWRCFARRWLIRGAYSLAPMLASVLGHLPGRRIGFGGNEARGVIRDWARSGRSGRYSVAGTVRDWERQLAALGLPLLAVRLADDWLGPASSLAWLLDKLPAAPRQVIELTAAQLQGPADHFSWMKTPEPLAAVIAPWLRGQQAAH
jgi:predicted alpha/beta hydrolase